MEDKTSADNAVKEDVTREVLMIVIRPIDSEKQNSMNRTNKWNNW